MLHRPLESAHEGFHPSAPEQFTQPWFSWATSMFAELLLKYCGIGGGA